MNELGPQGGPQQRGDDKAVPPTNRREKGPVEILCKEIEWRGFFDRRMETQNIFISFVDVLVSNIAEMRETAATIAPILTGKPPSDDSATVLVKVGALLTLGERDKMIAYAAEVHNFIHEVAPDDAYPCDHLIDMLSSCVSAVRFGLEKPCHSRHAAEAASHIWKQRYSIRLFDDFTSAWQRDWTRAQLQKAILNAALADSRADRRG